MWKAPQSWGVKRLRLEPKFIGWTSKVHKKKCTNITNSYHFANRGKWLRMGCEFLKLISCSAHLLLDFDNTSPLGQYRPIATKKAATLLNPG